MKKKTNPKNNYSSAKNPRELGNLLGLLGADVALMEYKSELTILAVNAIESSGLQVNEIVERSGVARSKVSAVKNAASVGVSCDLLIKIIAATGAKIVPPRAA